MERTEQKPGAVPLLQVALPLAAVACAGVELTLVQSGILSGERFAARVVFPLGRLLLYLCAGLIAAQVLEELGWTALLAQRLRPVTRWGRLKDESGACFISAFVSGFLAAAMLSEHYHDGRLDKREVFVTYVLSNGLPSYVMHLPTTFFIALSFAGTAGLLYLGITFLAAVMRTAGVLAYARAYLEPAPWVWSPVLPGQRKPKEPLALRFRKKFTDRFVRVILFTVPIYFILVLLTEWGLFTWIKTQTAAWFPGGTLPPATAGLVVFTFAAEFSSGMAAAGAFLDAGTLTARQVALALVFGTILSTPIRAIRYQLPTHAGLFGPAMAAELIVLSQSARVVSLILCTIPLWLWTSG